MFSNRVSTLLFCITLYCEPSSCVCHWLLIKKCDLWCDTLTHMLYLPECVSSDKSEVICQRKRMLLWRTTNNWMCLFLDDKDPHTVSVVCVGCDRLANCCVCTGKIIFGKCWEADLFFSELVQRDIILTEHCTLSNLSCVWKSSFGFTGWLDRNLINMNGNLEYSQLQIGATGSNCRKYRI